MKLQLIGTGTCNYNQERLSSSVLVELNNENFIFDFGPRVSHRLVFELGFELNDIQTIWLSHFHPDHISDIIPFFHSLSWSKSGWIKNKDSTHKIKIIGPEGLNDFFNKLFQLYPFPDLIRHELLPRVEFIELTGDSFHIFNTDFKLARLPHANNTAIKFNMNHKTIVLAGDSPYSEDEINFISGSDIAVIDYGHKTDDEIIKTAILSQCKQIVLSHIDRPINTKHLNDKAISDGYQGIIIEGHDFMELL